MYKHIYIYIRFQNLTLKIPTLLQHMLANPKPKTIMTQSTFTYLY